MNVERKRRLIMRARTLFLDELYEMRKGEPEGSFMEKALEQDMRDTRTVFEEVLDALEKTS
jgi:hypothetical protein